MKWQMLAFLLACVITTSAQQISWDSVQSSLSKKRNLVDLTQQLEEIKKAATLQHDYPTVARSWHVQMQIKDLTTEDTSFFTNSSFIDSILKNKQCDSFMRSMMLILKAKRVAHFRHYMFRRNNKTLFSLPDTAIDFRKLTQKQLDSLTQSFLEEARTISLQTKEVDIKKLLWLSTDPLLFLFKPSFTDLIFAEQLHYADAGLSMVWMHSIPLIEIRSGAFFLSNEKIPASFLPVFNLYKQWALLHQGEPGTLLFIELLAKKFFYSYDIKDGEENKQLLKLANLFEQNSNSVYSIAKAYSIYELATAWYTLGNNYANNSPIVYFRNNNHPNSFDTFYRFYYKKALALIEANNTLLDSFLYLKLKLIDIKEQVFAKNILIKSEGICLPGKLVPLHVSFKNIPGIYFNVVKLTSDYAGNNQHATYGDFLKMPIVRSTYIALPATDDYQTHAIDISIPALQAGKYAVLYSNSKNPDDSSGINGHFTITCSNIAAVNNDSRVFVLGRAKGRPLENTHLLIQYKKKYQDSLLSEKKHLVNTNGYVSVTEQNIEKVFAINGSDTCNINFKRHDEVKPYEVYDEDRDADLLEYYDDKLILHLFTDRAIYRPGQKVFFKGILMTRDPKTGERIVMNKQNLHFTWFKKLFNSEIKELWKTKFELGIEDPFGKKTDSFKLKINDYGSFAGSFLLKRNAPTGDWEFDTDYIDVDNQNDGSFKVEEYKRPTFEVKMEKPTAFLQMGDSFAVKVKVKSFAGAQLNNIMVDYDITASFQSLQKDSITGEENSIWQEEELADSTDYTDNNGELLLKVSANFLKAYKLFDDKSNDIRYSFNIDAIDGTGESHEEKLEVKLSNRPVKIDLQAQKIYEKNDLKLLSVTAKNEFAGAVNKKVEALLYRIEKPLQLEVNNDVTDFILLNEGWVYNTITKTVKTAAQEKLVYKTNFSANNEKLNFPDGLLQTGQYRLEVICKENEKILGEKKIDFAVFDKTANTYPCDKSDFHYLEKNGAVSNGYINWLFGTDQPVYSIYHAQYYSKTKSGVKEKNLYKLQIDQPGITAYKFKMPKDALDNIELTHLYILNNQLHKESQRVYRIKQISDDPQIIIEQYRKKLAPGGKETFAVTIKTKNENIAAELMTVMYDASLDKIEKFKWNQPQLDNRLYLRTRWDNSINDWSMSQQATYNFKSVKQNKPVAPLWWLTPVDHNYGNYWRLRIDEDDIHYNMLAGKVSGVSITGDKNLSEVVVVGYGTKKMSLTGAVSNIRIRGVASIDASNPPLIIIDGVPFTGDFSRFNADLISDGLVLNGADATTMFGSRAANGVILISTKGPLVLPKPEEPIIKIRKDFSETAFFYPQVYADADGFFKIEFTMPESVTEWNWKLLAHTKKAKFLFTERKIVTQLPLMVQPNMPRFLYQGDSIVLQSRVTNLDTTLLNGILTCVVEDAVTGENISNTIVKENNKNIIVQQQSNSNGFVSLAIPAGFLHPLKIKVSVSAGAVSDGEEYTIPVLSKKILVSQNQSFTVDKNKDTSITTPQLPSDAVPYGVSMYIQPKPQSAMVNALPYMAFYQFNCAEQTFNKMLAHAVVINVMRKDSAANMSMQQENDNEDEILKPVADELAEETMPWMLLNHSTQIQHQQLKKLMDTTEGKQLIEKYLKEIDALQNNDGGIAWFSGGKSNDYISCYLLGGFGKIKKDSIQFLFNKPDEELLKKMLPSLIQYTDTNFIRDNNYGFQSLFYLYSRSFWSNEFPAAPHVQSKADSILQVYWKDAEQYDLGKQALLILTSLKHDSKTDFKTSALKLLESIRQTSITDDINGIRWKAYSNADDFNSNDEEIIAMIAEAFEETGTSRKIVDGIIYWLLKSKEQHNWSTTKATAAILNILRRNQQTVSSLPATIKSNISNAQLSVTDNLFNGQSFSFTEANSFSKSITVINDNSMNAAGGINYYYFTTNSAAASAGNRASISKQLYRFNKETNQWEIINEKTILKIADKIKTDITISTAKQLKYVFIDDKKAAAFEPAEETKSGYEYGSNFNYYQSVRDAGMQFFAEQIPSGISTITYESVVAMEGNFYNGTTSLQCMYQPQVRAYSKGSNIKVVQ